MGGVLSAEHTGFGKQEAEIFNIALVFDDSNLKVKTRATKNAVMWKCITFESSV